jgi:hypothetical protein
LKKKEKEKTVEYYMGLGKTTPRNLPTTPKIKCDVVLRSALQTLDNHVSCWAKKIIFWELLRQLKFNKIMVKNGSCRTKKLKMVGSC